MLGIKIGLSGIVISGFLLIILGGLSLENIVPFNIINIIGISLICLFSCIFILGIISEQ